jgi:hypothetical protein
VDRRARREVERVVCEVRMAWRRVVKVWARSVGVWAGSAVG